MRIHIRIEEMAFERSLANIAALFDEDAAVTAGPGDAADAEWTIAVGVEDLDGGVRARAVLTEAGGGAPIEAEQVRAVPDGASNEERRAVRRQAAGAALLDALERRTGIVQPWGILTGVRPTKLLHDRNLRGISREETRRELRDLYRINDGKIALMERIVDRQLAVIPDLYHLGHEVSLYIGIPFCPTKCAYCTFPAYDINGRQGSVDGFLYGLHEEMRAIGDWLKRSGVGVTTIYYGGGTPTSISAEEMDALYALMYDAIPGIDRVREITVEAGRPDTITPEKLEVLRKWKIGRISINPQSYTQATLDRIGRWHTVEETIEKFQLARKHGMNNINMDLIIGLPGEGPEEFAYSLAETEKLMPESLTVHTLSFKRASEMTRHKGDGKYRVAGREDIVQMTAMAMEWTEAHGYVPYYLYRQKNILGNQENVGYAKPGAESLYNILMMEEMQSIIGIGCGATSKFIDPVTGEITRHANPKEPKAYIESWERAAETKIEALDRVFRAGAASV
ncbi:MAG: coproporphyrinogen III oxidase [Thermobacillus sp.]|uniref:Coproporphyrinogen dehydrogenase HemZ n=1 Tax=Thermobacillus composti (strain DSM 18247 / JCM 13945 / KWC4) TaxID=717605 RepID=L0EFZ5_THECK|nr:MULTISPECIES: coproporphyrinogen III oxidase [Thermobacillus]AGA58606.1 coproporphyrinogen dehydrogenase HemZ [Thermobacillus composti KWC4]REK52982.1 MAG: coproporphyrinogen III oxidase [Thermobacillus sp.]